MTDRTTENAGSNDVAAVEKLGQARQQILNELRKTIVGMDDVIEEMMIAIFAKGHVLLEGVPGLAKTLLVSSMVHSTKAWVVSIPRPTILPYSIS